MLIVDLDVHQGEPPPEARAGRLALTGAAAGNGNAALFAGDERVFTLSVHCTKNLFSARQRSDLDVDLPAGAGDEQYLEALSEALPAALEVRLPRPSCGR